MNESRLTKQIYRANVCDGKVRKGRPRKFYADHIGGILKKDKILSTQNRRACIEGYQKRTRSAKDRSPLCSAHGEALVDFEINSCGSSEGWRNENVAAPDAGAVKIKEEANEIRAEDFKGVNRINGL
ncbi:hypothetical protein EVAR_57143_1 [Eumeta japonica]|uniref:Uncharacterized protein n=1 Tax=Eumeta variegata TaxID=151549 RepID=A0A4C1YW53_EUMVA|nr:hypothetical protein EVAR_57143_1 [Eumeta japonica]